MNQYGNQNQDVKYNKLFINNNWFDSKNGKTYNKLNAYNGKTFTNFADGDKYDVDQAVNAAHNAYKHGSAWRNMDASNRGYLLFKLADFFDQHRDTLANLESLDTGKLYHHALNDVDFAQKTLRYYGGCADKMHGKTIQSNYKLNTHTYRDGYGVVGLIMSCNNPIINCAWQMGAAFAAGCTMVMKPHEYTSLTTLFIAQLTKDAGFPDGVFNVITGFGNTAGYAIACHMDIHKVSFFGNGDNARKVMQGAAQSNLKKVSFNLNLKNTFVVFNDYNLDDAVKIAQNGLFYNNNNNNYFGQYNMGYGNRVYVHEDIYDEFVRRSIDFARNRKIGNPFDKDSNHGLSGLLDEDRYNRMLNFVENGKKQGARLDYGGKRYGNQGWQFEPTIFSNVTDDMNFHHENFNGPIQCIFKFKTLDEAIYRTNYNNRDNFNHNFNGKNLNTGILTDNINNALAFSKYVHASNVWVNNYKGLTYHRNQNQNQDSHQFPNYYDIGHGFELGKHRVDRYMKNKTVTIRLHNNYHNYNYDNKNYDNKNYDNYNYDNNNYNKNYNNNNNNNYRGNNY